MQGTWSVSLGLEKAFHLVVHLNNNLNLQASIQFRESLSHFLSENWSYQQTLRKSPQNLNSPFFPEKSDRFLTNFGAAMWTKFRGFFMGCFD